MTQPQRHRDFIGPYQIGKRLGGGAFSSVYQARDPESGRNVAVKLLEHESALPLAAFRSEFQSVQDLHHPNIVRLETLLEHEGWTAIVMELVPGTDLLRYVRPSDNDGGCDEARLRACFVQLAAALCALHEAGVVHRDIKPQNVRVTPEGRVVLLDFGLVKHMTVRDEALDAPLVGTAEYNAPEQAKGGDQGPSADLYSFGVCLFEAVAGVRPFQHPSPHEVMRMKQERDAPLLSRLSPRTSSELHNLSWRLLQREPFRRPSARDVVEILEGRRSAIAASVTLTQPAPSGVRFLGRAEELSALRSALFGPPSRPRLLVVEGESGVGKSALVAEILRELEAAQPAAWVGRSRCYENERLALKAFDGAMAFFGRKISLFGAREQHAFLPAEFTALSPLFPALVAAPQYAPPPVELPADPPAKRRMALEVLTDLLERLGKVGPVVLAIDDLQWADSESLRLLDALARATKGPHLVATVRRREERPPPVQAALDSLLQAGHARLLSLEGLATKEAQQLARRMLGPDASQQTVEELVSESHGHPLWLEELSRFALRPAGERVLVGRTLEDALNARLDALSQEQQALIELVAIAAQPYPTLVFARALGIEEAALHVLAIPLLSSGLLRRRGDSDLASFHDRVRFVAQSRISPARTKALHAALARVLHGQPRAAKADIARHFDAAELQPEACAAHQEAGNASLAALAFADAAHHYGRALALALNTEVEPSLLTALRVQRAHALACGGHSAQAAEEYLLACEHAAPTQRIELRVLATKHLLQSAQVDAGLKAARELLAELRVPLPRRDRAAIARIAWDRMCLRFRGIEPKAEAAISPTERAKLDAMWNLGMPISMIELMAGATLSTRHLRRSLAAGDRAHVARALAGESVVMAMQNPGAVDGPNKLIDRARTLFDAKLNPALEAWVLLCEGVVGVCRAEHALVREKLVRAEALLCTRCPEEPWLLTQVRSVLASCWFLSGRLGENEETLERWLADAVERDDRFAIASLDAGGWGALRFLLHDEPDLARKRLHAATAGWPREPFSVVHHGELWSLHFAALYAGGAAALEHLERERERHQRAFLFKTSLGKEALSLFRVQASLSAYCGLETSALGVHYLRRTRIGSRLLPRAHMPLLRLKSPLIEAQLAIIDGHTERALKLTSAAALEHARLGLRSAEAPIAYLEGLLMGGDEGRAKQAQALALATAQGWKNPRKFVAMECPVIEWMQAK